MPCRRAAAARAGGQVQGLGVVGGDGQVPAVRAAGEHFLNLDMLPPIAPVAAAEHGDLGDYVHRAGGG